MCAQTVLGALVRSSGRGGDEHRRRTGDDHAAYVHGDQRDRAVRHRQDGDERRAHDADQAAGQPEVQARGHAGRARRDEADPDLVGHRPTPADQRHEHRECEVGRHRRPTGADLLAPPQEHRGADPRRRAVRPRLVDHRDGCGHVETAS